MQSSPIRQVLSTSENVSIKLAMSIFDTKIEPIITYGSVIWEIESNNDSIIIKIMEEVHKQSTREQVRPETLQERYQKNQR